MQSNRHSGIWAQLRLLAAFEAAKGLLILLAGLGMLSLLNHHLEALARQFIEHSLFFHHPRLNGVLLRAVQNITDSDLWAGASLALASSVLKFLEAYGLWQQRAWGQWLVLLSEGIYLPWEVLAILHHATMVRCLVLLFNVTLIVYVIWIRSTSSGREARR